MSLHSQTPQSVRPQPRPLPTGRPPTAPSPVHKVLFSPPSPPPLHRIQSATFPAHTSIPIDVPSNLPPSPPRPPLSKVSSRPTFIPYIQLDFDAVAADVSQHDGSSVTADHLLESLADKAEPALPCSLPNRSLLSQAPATTLNVSVADGGSESHPLRSDALVLNIRPHRDGDPTNEDSGQGFAISVPVRDERRTIEPVDLPESRTYSHARGASWPPFSKKKADVHTPLLQSGVDLSHSRMYRSSSKSAFVQRSGCRFSNDQQVVYAVPGTDRENAQATALVLPVVDSNNDLKELMLVVPPEETRQKEEDEVLNVGCGTTVGMARDVVDNISNMIPPMVNVDSSVQVHGTTRNATVQMNVTKQVSWVGYFILAVALLSVASQGTAVKWLPSVTGMIAASWMMQSQTLIMLPVALLQLMMMNRDEWKRMLTPTTWWLVVGGSVAQVCWASGFFLAIDYTTLFHAWSLNNVHSVAMVLLGLLGTVWNQNKRTQKVNGAEMNGAYIALLGVLLMQVSCILGGDVRALIGDSIAIASCFGAILFLEICKELRKKLPLFVMMTGISALNAVLFSVASTITSGTDFSLSDNGAFGWLRPDRIALALYLGGVVGMLGTVCCIAALKYVGNVVVGSVQTMMPVMGTIVAVLMGVSETPDLWTSLGGVVLMVGVAQIGDAKRQSETTVVLNKHLQHGLVENEAKKV